MIKYVYLLYGNEYEKGIINAVCDNADAFYFKPFVSSIICKLQMLHNARMLNRYAELPFKEIWFKRALKGIPLERDDEIYFLLYESFHLSYSLKFMSYLKKNYPKSKLCFMYLNPVTSLIAKKLERVADCLDAVITFNKKDAMEHGLVFAPLQPYKLPILKNDDIPQSDVFFVGSDKGRLPKLLSIYERLIDKGLKCDFHIVGVKEEDQKYSKDIVYNERISYSEVLERVYATKCVLEVLQGSEDYISIRTSEALQYHKKLLTESNSVRDFSFYNPELIQVFESAEKIDIDFITKEVDDSLFENSNPESAKCFHEFLNDNI